jgi:hypothetical protein
VSLSDQIIVYLEPDRRSGTLSPSQEELQEPANRKESRRSEAYHGSRPTLKGLLPLPPPSPRFKKAKRSGLPPPPPDNEPVEERRGWALRTS